MPLNPKFRSIPNKPDLASHSNEAYGHDGNRKQPSFETFGLSEEWRPAYDWADANEVLAELLVVIDTTLICKWPNRFGTVLREITRPIAREYLDRWHLTDQSAAALHRLSEAARADKTIFTAYRPLPTDSPAHIQLGDQTTRHYLFAVLLEQLPLTSPRERDWFIALRLWTLVHGIRRARVGNLQDRNLHTIARAIRQACDRHLRWRSLISSLATPVLGLEELNAFLRFGAEKIAGHKNVPSSHKEFSRALIAISRNEHLPEDPGSGRNRPRLLSELCPLCYSPTPEPNTLLFSTGIEGDPESRSWPGDEDDADGYIIETTVDSSKSYFHQTLEANGVLLQSAEEMQLLPWSYSRPNPLEGAELDEWIGRLLASGSPAERLLGAFAWIARHTGQSLRRTLDMPVLTTVGRGWALDPDSMTLRRLPPMRHSGWLPKNHLEQRWVAPVGTMNCLRLPDAAARALRARLQDQSDAVVLGALWSEAETPESAFRRLCPAPLARVTPGLIGNILPGDLHARTGDAVLARLISSHPNSGMPAACAYANWSNTAVEALLAGVPDLPSPGGGEPPIGAGSRLDPIEAFLLPALKAAAQRIEMLAGEGDLVRFHNAYVAYVAVVLLAATGARPVHDPFEAAAHFDFEFHFCYVNDKSSNDARDGRLVPLPPPVAEWIREDYCRYLSLLAQTLESRHPALAADIAALTRRGIQPCIPFLFMLSEEGELDWVSVSEKTIEGTDLFDWPLPLNLFRHRLAQRLRRRGVDPELIDAILGHSENAGATHGDGSTRTWLEDMKTVRPALTAIFADLDMPLIRCQPRLVSPAGRQLRQTREEILFGIEARQKNREARNDFARTHAGQLIDGYLVGRALPDLKENEVDELVKALLFSEHGLPRTLAHVYYGVFTERANNAWREAGKKVRIKRRYAWAKPAPSPFKEFAPSAITLHRDLAARLDEILHGVQASRLSLRECAGLAIAQLCLDHHICDVTVLRDVANGERFRLVTLKGNYWLEHAEAIAKAPADPDIAVRAYPVSPRTASILDRLLGKTENMDLCAKPVPRILAPLIGLLETSGRRRKAIDNCTAMAECLASLVDQVNAMTWPGVAAAYMAGRVSSFALNWRDRIRMEFGAAARFGNSEDDTAADADKQDAPDEDRQAGSLRACKETEATTLQLLAKDFLSGLNQVVSGQVESIDDLLPRSPVESKSKRRMPQPESGTAPAVGNKPSPERRRTLASLGRRYLRAWNGHVSTTVFLLGEWTVNLLTRHKRGNQFLALSSIARYLNALSPAFEDAGYDNNLMLMEEEEVTDFYLQVLVERGLKNPDYVEKRLGEFHRWAARLGVDDPDWSALPETVAGSGVSPGLLSETEYQTALRLLNHEKSADPHSSLAHAFLLLGCYRFGLRGKECLGLQREDWLDFGNGNIVVVVRDNRIRKLKTPAGRRQVPLLFELSDLERSVIGRWMLALESLHGDAQGTHMFAAVPQERLAINRLRHVRRVNEMIKLVSGNPGLSLHHVRHTAANRISAELLQLRNAAWVRACNHDGQPGNRKGMAQILLGRQGPTRRMGWAIARYLGHAGDGTLFHSYLHLFDVWVRELQGDVLTNNAVGRITRAHVLDRIPRLQPIDTSLLAAPPAPLPAVTVSGALQFMRLLAAGKSVTDAAATMRLSSESANEMHRALIKVGRQMRLSPLDRKKEKPTKKRKNPSPPKQAKQEADSLEFLRRVSPHAWARMIRLSKAAQKKPLRQPEGLETLSVEDAAGMVGTTRQLVMWEPAHFKLVRVAVDLLDIPSHRFVVAHSSSWTDRHREEAHAAGFEVKDALAASGKRSLQLDSAFEGENQNRVEKRCVFLLEQNGVFSIRDRLEMVVAFLAVAATLLPPRPAVSGRSIDK